MKAKLVERARPWMDARLASLSPRVGSALAHGTYAFCRVHAAAYRRLERARAQVQELAAQALTTEELERLAPRLYRERRSFGPPDLFGWEEQWYREVLPSAPAKVLVGGCGSGREMLALRNSGYEVWGSDPSASLCRTARHALGSSSSVWALSYQQWLTREGERALQKFAPYDAVLFGWASVGYLLDPRSRLSVLELACRLCPRGPILLSYVQAPERRGSSSPLCLPGEATEASAGLRLGRALRRARGLPAGPGDRVRLIPHAGAVHLFDPNELEELARNLRRKLQLADGAKRREAQSHCTLLPPPPSHSQC